jgi:hypothetical protein
MTIIAHSNRPGFLRCSGFLNWASLGWPGWVDMEYYTEPTVIDDLRHNQFFNSCSEPSLELAENRARTSLDQQTRSLETFFQGGVQLGEFHKTLKLLRSPMQSLFKSIGSYSRRAKKRAQRSVRGVRGVKKRSLLQNRVVQDTYLEYTFAISPLLSEVDGMSKWLAHLVVNPQRPLTKIITAVGVHETKATPRRTASHLPYASGRHYKVGATGYLSKKAKVVYKACYGLTDSANPYWSARSVGLGLRDFLPTVWELIPYSFLVDYFTNIGDMVSAAGQHSTDYRWVMRTEVIETKRSLAFHREPVAYPKINWVVPGTPASRVDKTIGRQPYDGGLSVGFSWDTPSFRQWFNVGALARWRR